MIPLDFRFCKDGTVRSVKTSIGHSEMPCCADLFIRYVRCSAKPCSVEEVLAAIS